MLENAEIYNFSAGGKNYVFDVQNVEVFEVSDIVKDIFELPEKSEEEILKILSGKYPKEKIRDSLENLKKVVENGFFRQKKEEVKIPNDYKKNLFALQLNISHACNMACKYCYASHGSYGGKEGFMSWETAKKSVDFLFENSNSKNLQIRFFGGEPMLNFDVVKKTVEYANERAEKESRIVNYLINTNGTIMNDAIKKFLIENKKNLRLSISLDGTKEAHDRFRKFKDGKGSYDIVMNNMREFLKGETADCTIVHGNEKLAETLSWLDRFGFEKICLVPEHGETNPELELREEDYKVIDEQYDKILELISSGKVEKMPRTIKTGLDLITYALKKKYFCFIGKDALSVTPEGDFYPCHGLISNINAKIGNLKEGFINQDKLIEQFYKPHIDCERCEKCWARYLCGGGCQLYKYGVKMKPKCRFHKKEADVALKVFASKEKNIVKIE